MLMLGKFSPLKVPGCALWLEADRGITLDGSNNVSAWADQSGNGRAVSQGDPTKRAAYTASTIGGRPGLTCTGNQGYSMLTGLDLCRNVSGMTFLSVYQVSNNAVLSYAFAAAVGTSTNSRMRIGGGSSAAQLNLGGRRLDADALDNSNLNNGWTLTPSILTIKSDYANSNLYTWLNGTAGISDTGWLTDGTVSDTDSNYICVGALSASPANPFFGTLCVLLAWKRVLTVPEQQYLERGYGRKYGITVA